MSHLDNITSQLTRVPLAGNIESLGGSMGGWPVRTSVASRLVLMLLVASEWVPAAPVPAEAQLVVTSFEDVSPDSSTLDPSDPDGATGGRVNGTAVDPNSPMILYAASEWGGIYKSTDGGDIWARLDGHRPVATWDVEVDPSNSMRVYATSFFDGRSPSLSGINVSTDGGVTWTHPATAVPPAAFCANAADQTELTAFGIDIDPANNANVYVGTSCGLAISTDSGVSWSFTSPVAGAGRIWDLLVTSIGAFVDTCGDDGHWFFDTRSGTWTAGSGLPSGRCSIARSPYSAASNYEMVAVVGTSIYETNNRGQSWANTRTNPNPQGRIPFVATNRRSTAPAGTKYDLWFGDVSLYSVTCDTTASPECGTGNSPSWSPGYTRQVGGHDDMGSILFDPSAANDACPILMSSDGGVYRNLKSTSPDCQIPTWEQPTVSPHGLWPWAMAGADRAGVSAEDLYFGTQDNGVFGATNAGATKPTWVNDRCCDGFDTAADDFGPGAIIYSQCCFFGGRFVRFFKKGAGFGGGGEINYPPSGLPPTFTFPDSIVNWGDKEYVMVTRDCTVGAGGCEGADGGVFVTVDADASPIIWSELGNATEPPSDSICGVKAATYANGIPVFYVQTGSCNADSTTDRVFRYLSAAANGEWTEIFLPTGGFGIFAVSESDPNLLLASGFTSTDARMYKSTDRGSSWTSLGELDTLMRGGGDFPIKNNRGLDSAGGAFDMGGYHQPSLVAIDPADSNIMVAGGRDSGVFLSTDAGTGWRLVTDPRTSHTSGIPHIPRPWHAYFDEEPGTKAIYLSSQGRGIWRLTLECGDDEFEGEGLYGTDDTCFGALLDETPLGGLVNTQTHLHCDEDWVWTRLARGRTYEIKTENLIGGSDTTLSLHARKSVPPFGQFVCSEEVVAFDDNSGPGLASLIQYTVPLTYESERHDVRIRQVDDDYYQGEGYDITVRELCPTDLTFADQTMSDKVAFPIAENTITLGPNLSGIHWAELHLTAGSMVQVLNGFSWASIFPLSVTISPNPCP